MDQSGFVFGLSGLPMITNAVTRSISAENFSGEKGKGGMATEGTGARAARDLGKTWKVSPSVVVKAGSTFSLADVEGSGIIQHIWITGDIARKGPLARYYILRMYWDDQDQPSVEVPVADFFASGWGVFSQINSQPVVVNPNKGYNCFWPMPFRKRARITIENRHEEDITVYYQITYALTDVAESAGMFHAQFRRSNPLEYKTDHTIVEGITGAGQYVGTAIAWGVNNCGWWGEGEIKFFMDGDKDFPTICGTGTEDYFGGAYDWDVDGKYVTYTTQYMGMNQVIQSDGLYRSQMRFSMYRWHIMDPIRFQQDLRVTIQALGWRSGRRYLPLQDDISSVAYWYQTLPAAPFPELPDVDFLEII